MLTKKNNVIEQKIDFTAFKQGLLFEFNYLSSYVMLMSSSVSEKVDEYEERLFTEIDSGSEEFDIDTDFYHEASKIKSYFYNSLIVMVYTVYESTLNKICIQVNSNVKSKLDHESLKDRNVSKKFLTYLNIVADIDFQKDKRSYDRIREFQNLRNQIAHENSTVKGNNNRDRKKNSIALLVTFNRNCENISERNIIVNEETWDFYVNKTDLIIEFIDVVKKYLFGLIEELESKIFIV
jgi:hypothetical protein